MTKTNYELAYNQGYSDGINGVKNKSYLYSSQEQAYKAGYEKGLQKRLKDSRRDKDKR